MSGGELFIRAAFADGRILLRETRLSRPPLTRLLIGMGEREALAAIPTLYSLCREAQTAAAAAALARAKGEEPPGNLATDRLWVEMLHERLWRLCLDWPRVLNCSAAKIDMARQTFATWRASLYQQDCLERTPTPCLQVLQTARQALILLEDILPSAPSALLDGATDIVHAWREKRFYPFFSTTFAPDRGRSVILTARGWLQHEVMLRGDGKIISYAIHAPTDRKFADSRQLAARIANCSPLNLEEAKTALERAVLSLDPCVPWEIVWES
ncbi:MAG: hypothetical protein FWH15_01900 [Betaproteobacteria bacterium]|nr:hypothetical protein [Betaproteobacteria bacterium]